MGDVSELLESLRDVSRQAAALLAQDDPAPERVEELLRKRGEIFSSVQQAYAELVGDDGDNAIASHEAATLKALAAEIVELNRTCISLAQNHLERLEVRLENLKLQQRGLTAYGYVDPKFAPRGVFFDKRQD